MKAKELGYVLAIDQASNCAGASLWHDGTILDTTTLNAKKTHAIGRRLVTQIVQLDAWLDSKSLAEPIRTLIFEGVRARLVLITVGAFTSSKYLQDCKLNAKHSFVESLSWKNWARKRGAAGPIKDIKGVKALQDIGWDMLKFPVESDDEADSILIYLAWRDRL
jgi:hypothetical protein